MKNIYHNYLETHYFMRDGSHSMDAFVFNKCQADVLDIFLEIKKQIDIKEHVKLEVSALNEGGIIQWLQSLSYQDYAATASLLIATLELILSRIPKKENKLENQTTQLDLQKRELEIEILKIKLEELNKYKSEEISEKVTSLANYYEVSMQNLMVRKKLSNLYKRLLSCEKITSVSYHYYDHNKIEIFMPGEVSRENFDAFLLDMEEIIEIDENARIHIYSPNLVNRKHKWRGYYEKESKIIEFNMLDKDFMNEIQNQIVDFKNGSMIDAVLHTKIKFDKLGNESSRIYSVGTVLTKIDGNKFIETPQGKNYKFKKEFLKKQQNLDLDL